MDTLGWLSPLLYSRMELWLGVGLADRGAWGQALKRSLRLGYESD
jgi:hypothetical protein